MLGRLGGFFFCCVVCAQPSPRDPGRLPEIRETAIATLFSQPNYTCLETVNRRHEVNGALELEDRLRLEVAIVSGKEMFGWPGSAGFEDLDVMNVVRGGLFDTGNFGIYPRMLFFGDAATFTDRGDAELNKRPVLRYDFVVPQAASGFHIQRKNIDVALGFHGSIYVDPTSFELMRLVAIADALPESLGLTGVEDTVDYGRIALGEGSFLLPTSSESVTTGPKTTDRGRVQFSSCARFAGESRLIFDDPQSGGRGASQSRREVTLPAGTEFALSIPEIDLATAAVGDRVSGTVLNDLKRGKEILVPKGAIASGRITKLSRYPKQDRLAVRFQELEWKGSSARVNAELKSIESNRAKLDDATKDVVVDRSTRPKLTGLSMTWKIVP